MIRYFQEIMKSVENAVTSLDEAAFDQLVEECIAALSAGHKIIVSGLGKNVPVCDKFVGTMNSLGQNAAFMNTSSAVHGDIGMVHPGDVVIVLTKSGETVESVYLTELLQKRGADIWLLTFRKESTLTRMIPKHLILDLQNEGDQWDIVPNNSTTVNLIILQGLAMEIVRRRGVTLQDFKQNHPGGYIGEQLKNV
ncbi:SIS domain-containing protein [Pseudoflavonifractor sp. 524-17]|uniref:SIS domain-containing protein n=1 Tax=Pseudoflavonifractor sp. 524-17 TaxID=2304577 RepID=UPI00137A8A97|nr:SIS domain-containing protein [Pseudoflavonifractor sp. 524-17]NCE65623.1 SIS domain-containing protein [Pseudoflavonifractor sp. 524-17]